MSRVVLLGPQRESRTLGHEVSSVRDGGRVALITAGWQEWEGDDDWVRRELGGDVVNLGLYGRAEEVWRHDPEFARAHRELQSRVRLLRRTYNQRLAHQMNAWIDLEVMEGDAEVLDPERRFALEQVRRLDAHHLRRIEGLRADFEARWHPGERDVVAHHRHQIAEATRDASVVVVAGGHVASLLNRLRLFHLGPLLGGRPVVAWSGGAMVLTPRVVLFHDSPPWGPGHAEVGETGMGLCREIVALPHAGQRLRLDDPGRVARMARRFAPAACVVLDPGTRAEWDGSGWVDVRGGRLDEEGSVGPWRSVA